MPDHQRVVVCYSVVRVKTVDQTVFTDQTKDKSKYVIFRLGIL